MHHVLTLVLVFASGVPSAQKPSPLSPADALPTFSLSEGFLIELVASEPAVQDPVAVAWDAMGRMYVAEMGDYPNRDQGGFIKRLEDRNGDGIHETSVVFAGPLPFPTSVLPHGNGILVAAAPDILYLEDTDGDGKADRTEKLLTGFGEGNQQLRVNGLTRSLDNWIHGANGRSNGIVTIISHPEIQPMPLANHDFRFKPSTGRLERTAGFAQFGKAFDRWGNHFVNWNTIPIRQVVVGQQYLDRNPTLTVASSMLDISDPRDGGRIYPITAPQTRFNREPTGAFNASCGIAIDRGGLFEGEFAHGAYVCEPLGNLVHRMVLEQQGVTFLAQRGKKEQTSEFLASSDPWFRPVNLATGPDGCLYVVDFHREWVEHPQFVPDELEKGIDFTRGEGLGRIYRIRPKDRASPPIAKLAERSSQQLVTFLEHPNGWCRETAQRLLLERNDRAIVPDLHRFGGESKSPLGRLHALWTLDGLNALENADIERALLDPEPNVRRHALMASETRLDASDSLFGAAARLAQDEDPAVRFQLACSIGASNRIDVVHVLARIAARDSSDPWTRLAMLTSLHRSSAKFLAVWIREDAGWREPPTQSRLDFVAEVAELAGVCNLDDDVRALDQWIGMPDTDSRSWLRLAALVGLNHGLLRHGLDLGTRRTEERDDAQDRLRPWFEQCRAWSVSREVPLPARLLAVRLLVTDRSEPTTETLAQLLEPSMPAEMRLAATRAFARRPERAVAGRLLAHWSGAEPGLRRALAGAILRHPERSMELLLAIEQGVVDPGELDLECRQSLLQSTDSAVQAKARSLFAATSSAGREEIVKSYQKALELTGKPEVGRELFQKNCSTCHRSEGRGPLVGPELSGLATKTPAQLLVDILDPNREVLPNFISYIAVTKDGEVRTGLLAAESDGAITLRRAEGVTETLLRAEIEELRVTGRSLMPEGFEQNLSPQDLANLIAYLRRTQ